MSTQPPRPDFIRSWRELESQKPFQVRPEAEAFGYPVQFAAATGLHRLRVMHLRLAPGQRTNPPAAWRDEEEFFFVLEGTPDLWLDGYLYRLDEGDCVGLAEGTGIGHSILNNSDKDVRLFALGESMRIGSQAFHPLTRDVMANENLKKMRKFWATHPKRQLGPHDGLTDARRDAPMPDGSRKPGKPPVVLHWRDVIENKPVRYPGSDEDTVLDAPLGKKFRFGHIGVRFQILKPGRRTSWPHAERSEDEFVFVVKGHVECWLNGWLYPMKEGDFVGFAAGTGITHTIINNTNEEAWLMVGGVASRVRNEFFYVFHEKRNKDVGDLYWKDHPPLKLGPHDGMPDALRGKERAPAEKPKAMASAKPAAKQKNTFKPKRK